ncbi:MAG: TolC family protein [Deltaproteobacteria bacterium]|nr:TolC family protein [Deltaproteobacteria bacterium]
MYLVLLTLWALPTGAPETPIGADGRRLPIVSPGPSLTLADAMRAADERNLTLATTRVEIDKARALLSQAQATLFPMLAGQGLYTRNDHEDTADLAGGLAPLLSTFGIALPPIPGMVIRREQELRVGATASLPIINLQGWIGISAARLGLEVVELTVANARRQLLFGVAQAFWMAHVGHELVAIQESQLQAARHHLQVARARVEAGDAMRIDVVRAETEVEKTYQDLLAAHLGLDNARDALATLIATKELPLPVEPPPLAAPGVFESSAISSKRLDLQAAAAGARAADKSLQVSRMQLLPVLAVSGQYGYLFTEPPELGSQDRSRWSAMLTLTVPIYNQLRYADLEQKRAALRQAELRAAELETSVELEVRKARRDYLAALSTATTAERQAALTREALTLTEAAYENGAATSLDVTDAQRNRQTAELNAATQRLRGQMTLLALLHAMGESPEALAAVDNVE